MKALRFEFNQSVNDYSEKLNNVPQEILDLLDEGYFDDNGDLPHGDVILIPINDLSKAVDLSNYELVEVNEYEYPTDEYGDFLRDEDGNLVEPSGYYMGFTSRGYYLEVTANFFLVEANKEDEVTKYLSIPTSMIKDMYIHDTYGEYGQIIGYSDSGDYSVFNHSCDLYQECINAVNEKFLSDFETEDIEINDDFSIYWSGYDKEGNYVELSDDLKEKIQKFIEEYEEANCHYDECQGFNFWNGHNWDSVIVQREFDDFKSHELIDDKFLIKELNEAIDKSKFYKDGTGYREYRYGKWSLVISQWQGHFEDFEISEITEE